MKLSDPAIPPGSTHVSVIETILNIVTLLNNGKMAFQEGVAVPTDVPNGPEARLVTTGGKYYVYFFLSSIQAWKRVELT